MLIMQILQDEPPSPRKLDVRLPRDVETICLQRLGLDHKCLAFQHSGRPERLTDPEVTGVRVVHELLS